MAKCVSVDGKEYIDFTAGIGVNCLGFCDDGWVKAVTTQLKKLQHVSNLFYSEPQVKAADLLTKKTGLKKVFFGNSGAEPMKRPSRRLVNMVRRSGENM